MAWILLVWEPGLTSGGGGFGSHLWCDEAMTNVIRKWQNKPVESLKLSTRSINALTYYKRDNPVRTVGDLISHHEDDLRRLKNFGEHSLAEVKTALAERGLSLGMRRVLAPKLLPSRLTTEDREQIALEVSREVIAYLERWLESREPKV